MIVEIWIKSSLPSRILFFTVDRRGGGKAFFILPILLKGRFKIFVL